MVSAPLWPMPHPFFFSLYILCFIFVQSVVSHCNQAVIELVTVLLPQPPECCEVTEASASPGSVSLLWSAVAGPREPQALGPGWADLPFLFLLRSLPPRPSLCGQARRPQQLPAFALLRSVLKGEGSLEFVHFRGTL